MAGTPAAAPLGRPAFLKLRHGAYVKVDRIGYAGIRLREADNVWEIFVAEDPRRGGLAHIVDESLSHDAAQAACDQLMARIATVVS